MWASKKQELAAGSVVVLATVAGLLAQSAGERPKVATGLWETTVTSHMSGEGMPAALTNTPHTTRFRSCATEKNIDEAFLSAQQQGQGDCTRSNEKMSSTGFSTDFTCNSGMQGHVDVVFDSDTEAHITMHGSGQIGGKAMQFDSASTSRHISPDCGSVSPDHAQIIH